VVVDGLLLLRISSAFTAFSIFGFLASLAALRSATFLAFASRFSTFACANLSGFAETLPSIVRKFT
jgi:hypothetical protein